VISSASTISGEQLDSHLGRTKNAAGAIRISSPKNLAFRVATSQYCPICGTMLSISIAHSVTTRVAHHYPPDGRSSQR
jgi:hypothetical protein